MKILTTTPNGYQRRNWSTPKNYWMIFISSICLNRDHYDPKLPPFHFLDSISPHSLHFKKKIKFILEYLWTFWSAVFFALTCLLVFCSTVSVVIWYLYSKAVFVAKLGYLYFSAVSLVVVDYLYSCFINYRHSHPLCCRENNNYQTNEITNFQFWQSTWPEKSYHLLPYPPSRFPLPVL